MAPDDTSYLREAMARLEGKLDTLLVQLEAGDNAVRALVKGNADRLNNHEVRIAEIDAKAEAAHRRLDKQEKTWARMIGVGIGISVATGGSFAWLSSIFGGG